MKARRRTFVFGLAVALALGAPLLLVEACSSTQLQAPSIESSAVPPGSTDTSGNTPFEVAADKVDHVVVLVTIEQSVAGQSAPAGNGSGIIIRQDGYVLTNDHVVADATGLMVTLGNEQLPAKVVGRDPSSDLAVVKVDRTGLPTAEPGDPQALKRGEWVIAVGSPFGLPRSVSAGIVSALDRSTMDPTGGTPAKYTNMIQTDAAVNPGNSGGALATLDGKIVGVNSLGESPTGGSSGVNLAIPFDYAMEVADQIIKTGKAVHPYIGVDVIDLDPHVAAMLGVKGATTGALVQSVVSGGPAAKAGIKAGDVITGLGGQAVPDAATVFAATRKQQIGATVPVALVRNGAKQVLQVKIAAGSSG